MKMIYNRAVQKAKQNQFGRLIHACFVPPPNSLQLTRTICRTMSAMTQKGSFTPSTSILRRLSEFTSEQVELSRKSLIGRWERLHLNATHSQNSCWRGQSPWRCPDSWMGHCSDSSLEMYTERSMQFEQHCEARVRVVLLFGPCSVCWDSTLSSTSCGFNSNLSFP